MVHFIWIMEFKRYIDHTYNIIYKHRYSIKLSVVLRKQTKAYQKYATVLRNAGADNKLYEPYCMSISYVEII